MQGDQRRFVTGGAVIRERLQKLDPEPFRGDLLILGWGDHRESELLFGKDSREEGSALRTPFTFEGSSMVGSIRPEPV